MFLMALFLIQIRQTIVSREYQFDAAVIFAVPTLTIVKTVYRIIILNAKNYQQCTEIKAITTTNITTLRDPLQEGN